MTPDEAEAIYCQVIDAVNRQDVTALDRLLDPQLIDHNPIPGQVAGRDGFKQWMTAARTSFPDLAATIDDVFAKGDRVAGRGTWRGAQHGPFCDKIRRGSCRGRV